MSKKTLIALTVGSDLASQLLNGTALHQLALDEALSVSEEIGAELIEIKGQDLLQTLKDADFDIVVIHDELRPLVSRAQIKKTIESLGNFDAIRPTMAFTETIKSLDSEHRLNQTIDREKVRRISSPEVIRKSVIDFGGAIGTWTLPLINGTKTSEIESEPQGIRVNNPEELKMLEALLQLSNLAQK